MGLAPVAPPGASGTEEFLATLDESEYTETLIGQLVGGNLPRHRFELALPDDQIVTGSVADDVLPLLSHFSFGARCRAEIVVAVVSTPAGLTRQSRTLVGLDDVED